MKVQKIKQKDKEITWSISRLMKMSGTNLTKVCEAHGLNYANTYSALNREEIDLKFVRDLIKKINPEASLNVGFSLSLEMENKSIINHKSGKHEKQKEASA